MNLFSLSSALIFMSSSILALFVLVKGRRKKDNYLWAIFCFVVAFWGLGGFKFSTAASRELAFFWWKITFVGVIFIPVLYTHFVLTFLKLKKKYLLGTVYVFAGIFSFMNLFCEELFLGDIRFVFGQFYWVDWMKNKSPIFLFFYITFYWILFGYAFLQLGKYSLKEKGVRRNQLKYFMIATIFGWGGAEPIFLPAFHIDIYPYSNFLTAIYPLIMTVAIIKHRLMDIKITIKRGAILLVVYGFIVGIPLIFAGIGKPFFQYYFQEKWFIPPLGLYTLLALLAPYIYLTLQNKAEEKRMKRQLHLHQSLKAASQTTIEVQSIDKLSKIIPRYLLRLYGRLDNNISQISLFLKDKNKKAYYLKSSVGKERLVTDTMIPSDSYLVKWFTIIREVLVEKGVLKVKETEVLVYEELDLWLSNPNVLRVPFKGLGKILKELKSTMKSLNANVILPSVYQKDLLGFLILGEKIPDPYTTSDIDTFSILANDSAMAFKAAQLFEDLKTAQARLIQSEKLNLLGQLASSMAHEINNPLAIISGNIQLLLMDENDDKKKAILKKVNDQTERGYKIINRLLNFSRLSKEDIKEIEIHALVDDTLELINHKILHGNIQLDKNYNCTKHIKGNPTQIQEVLLNLFVNAVQAMPEGGQLQISTCDLADKVEVVVRDTGKGIPENDVENVFDPFYTQGKENGTGLGLFVASQIMGLHGGSIDIKSKLGEGTTFVLRFEIGTKK